MTDPYDLAFPTEHCPGLTKREYFAAIALQGLLSSFGAISRYDLEIKAVEYADALIVALNQSSAVAAPAGEEEQT